MKNRTLAFLLLAAPLTACGNDLNARDGWVREAPPGAMMMAAYLTLENKGADGCTVRKVSSPDFGSVEVHETRLIDGQMRMREVELVLAPQTQVSLKPGGMHLMLMEPRRALKTGDRVPFTFDCGGRLIETALPVASGAPGSSGR